MYDLHDGRGVPASRGVPMGVRLLMALGILLTFAIGAWTILDAGYGHVWPATNSERIKL